MCEVGSNFKTFGGMGLREYSYDTSPKSDGPVPVP